MEYMIKLNLNVFNKIFCDLDSDRKKELQTLVLQGSVINPLSGEVFSNNTRIGVTDYFSEAFFIEEDEPLQDKMNDEKLIIASRMTGSTTDPCQYICIGKGLNGYHAQAWDPNSREGYGETCPIYPLRIETGEGKWEYLPIWFESRRKASLDS